MLTFIHKDSDSSTVYKKHMRLDGIDLQLITLIRG